MAIIRTRRKIPKTEYQERLVVFIDILGFSDIVRKSERSPGSINLIYESLKFLKGREISTNWDLQLIEIEEDAQKRNMVEFNIVDRTNCTSFSDSIAVTVNCDENNINESFSTLISNLSYVGATLMMKGILFRGGITIGNVVHTPDGIIFGQGLIDAYQLESSSAIFPRVLLSDRLIKKLNYPLESKRDRYPYHQYIKRFSDGSVGFHQMIYFEVLQSWVEMSKIKLTQSLNKIKNTIIKGLDSSFENPRVFEKYLWLKTEYESLNIEEKFKPKIHELNENIAGQNIHYSYTDDYYENKTSH
ncbi:MAG TPA: hypothetical protein DER09_02865 [Prolixibacteraceae bacterium]|nr:hypothetical protein [Prolixibacteraceae bacterium]